jgi:hypothetical protein
MTGVKWSIILKFHNCRFLSHHKNDILEFYLKWALENAYNILGLKFSKRWLRRVLSSGIYWRVAGESQPTFRSNISPPTSGSKIEPSKKPALLTACFMLVPCLAYSSTLKINAMFSFETSVDFYSTTLRYVSGTQLLLMINHEEKPSSGLERTLLVKLDVFN